jgi:hypothetical protein
MQNRCHFTGSFVDYLTTLSQLMDVVAGESVVLLCVCSFVYFLTSLRGVQWCKCIIAYSRHNAVFIGWSDAVPWSEMLKRGI